MSRSKNRTEQLLDHISSFKAPMSMASSRIFITGATGFIGAHVLDVTLKAGYRARVSVRKSEQIQKFKNRYPTYSDKLDFVVVPDISQANAFHQSLQGVDHIFHLASPMPGTGQDFKKDYVRPAVNGTEAILQAAQDHATVKTLVLMSSGLALGPINLFQIPDYHFKSNTGEVFPVDVDMKFPENDPSHGTKYTGSKILAHQASRDFLSKTQPHFKLVTLHPVFVIGTDLNQNSAETVTGINARAWQDLHLEKPILPSNWVHVRDIADAHVRVLENIDSIKTGTEFVLAAPPFDYQELIDYVKNQYPSIPVKMQGPFTYKWTTDVAITDEKLGIKWKGWQTILRDLVDQQLSYVKT